MSSNTLTEAHPKRWLIAYNSVSSSLWLIVFFNTVLLSLLVGQPSVFQLSNVGLTLIQTFAVAEIYNSVAGHVRSPVFTTTVQVFSRLMIVYGICQVLRQSPANTHWCYITLSLSWSITEVIRYYFYASNLKTPGEVPYWLVWSRYSTFLVLYPTGVMSEIAMIYLSLDEATRVVGKWYYYTLVIIIFSYIPGFYMLFTYMLKQRKKVLGKSTTKEKKNE